MLSEKEILNNLERHRCQPSVSAQQYFNTLQKSLLLEFKEKRRIYLDTKYWVLLRDASMGRPKTSSLTEILNLIRNLVASGRLVCPVSDAAYIELMRQTDSRTRIATAELMDQLSCGVAVATEKTRIRNELINFLVDPAQKFDSLNEKAWVKIGFVLGETVPYIKTATTDFNLLAQKSFIDLIWHQTTTDFAMQEQETRHNILVDVAEKINEKMVEYADEIRSFNQAATAEFSGCIKLFDKKLASLMLVKKGYKGATNDEVEKYKEKMQQLLFNMFRLRPDFMAQRVPTLFIHSMCHAAIRWDKRRRIDSHWIVDIHHACAGIPYYNAMFTEHPLLALLKSNNMRMDKRFRNTILSDEHDILNYLINWE